MKEVYILRAVPGAGKSTVAESLDGTICCADDYFMDQNGNYNFDMSKISKAHGYCKHKFKTALENGDERIIVANTSVEAKDVKYYRKLALEKGYMVFVLTVENWHDGKDVHNVPEETKTNMANKLMKSIKLISLLIMMFSCKTTYSQYNFDTVYNKVVQSKIKFPGLIMSLAVAESGYNSADEDSFLTASNNLWTLTKTSKCLCSFDSITGLAKYKNIDSSIYDLNKRIGKLISGCINEDQAISVLAWYYLERVDKHMDYNVWKHRLISIRNDMPY